VTKGDRYRGETQEETQNGEETQEETWGKTEKEKKDVQGQK
jgi:hypothetical protein